MPVSFFERNRYFAALPMRLQPVPKVRVSLREPKAPIPPVRATGKSAAEGRAAYLSHAMGSGKLKVSTNIFACRKESINLDRENTWIIEAFRKAKDKEDWNDLANRLAKLLPYINEIQGFLDLAIKNRNKFLI